jgi:hypothetical protein
VDRFGGDNLAAAMIINAAEGDHLAVSRQFVDLG